MRFARTCLIPLILLAMSSGCASLEGGTFDADGYHHNVLDYTVVPGEDGRLLSRDWLLDNFIPEETGAPSQKIKLGESYQTDLGVDSNGDGLANRTIRVPLYDLRYLHRRDRGRIWLRSVPLSVTNDETDLRVLMRDYVDSMAGPGLTTVSIGSDNDVEIQVDDRRYATKMLAKAPAEVDGHDAYAALIEIANVHQLELSPDSRWERAELILIRTDYIWTTKQSRLPVLLIAGYSNLPEDFDSGRSAFRGFVEQIRLIAPPEPPEQFRSEIWRCVGEDVTHVRAVIVQDMRRIRFDSPDLDFAERDCVASGVEEHLRLDPSKRFELREGSYLAVRGRVDSSRATVVPRLELAE